MGKIIGIIAGCFVGLLLLALVLRRPTYYPAPAAASRGFWGNLGAFLGAGIAAAAGSKAKSATPAGALVVERGLPGYGNNAVVYMPSGSESFNRSPSYGVGDAAGSGTAKGSEYERQMLAEGYSAEELAAYL